LHVGGCPQPIAGEARAVLSTITIEVDYGGVTTVTYRNRPAILALACLGALLITGCASNPQASHPSPQTSGSTPLRGNPSPTATQSAGPPQRPTAAEGLTLAAAEVFVRHYVELLNYSYTTGDPEPLLAASDPGCVGCKGIGDYVRKVNGANGGLTGDYKDTLMNVKEIFRGASGRAGGSATIESGSYVERATPGASPLPQTGRTGTMEFTLSSASGSWIMYEMELKE
jgi:hypothetical protein